MSWQSYVDDQLIGAGFNDAAILGSADGAAWASSKNLGLKEGEGANIVALFSNPSNAFSKGIVVSGVKYLAIKCDERSVYGKKGTGGIVLAKATTCIVLAIYDDKIRPGSAALIVEKLADYLRENGC